MDKRRLRFNIGIAILWAIMLGTTLYIYLHPVELKKAFEKPQQRGHP